jgi:hypothetical protein
MFCSQIVYDGATLDSVMKSPAMRIPAVAMLAGLIVVACGDDGGVSLRTDVGVDAATDTAADVIEDAVAVDSVDDAADTGPDVEDAEVSDIAPSDIGVADSSDVVDATDATDAAPADDVADVSDSGGAADTVDAVDPPGGEGCDTTAVCPVGFVCIEDFCRVPLTARAMAEDSFDILEPEEIADAFALIKSFAVDVKFMMIETQLGVPETAPVSAAYAAADIVDPRLDPITVRWQEDPLGPMVFSPVVSAEDPDGRSWGSAPFDYDLSARVTVSLGDRSFSGDMGFEALEVVLTLTLDPDSDAAAGTLRGLVTRAETERRTLMAVDEFPGFAALFCSDRDYLPADDEWNMSDVFDCNGAVLDADADGDGVLDAYVAVISATFDPVTRLP